MSSLLINCQTGQTPELAPIMSDDENIYIITRSGKRELLSTDMITKRLKLLTNKHPKIQHINVYDIMLHVSQGISKDITTYEIDEYCANIAASMSLNNPNYMKLAARIAIDNHQKNTIDNFTSKIKAAYNREVKQNGTLLHQPMISNEFYQFVINYEKQIEDLIDYNRDFLFDFFGFRTFQQLYAIKIDNKFIERPQDMYMRVAIALHFQDNNLPLDNQPDRNNILIMFDKIKKTYNALSLQHYTHASPVYFNTGTNHTQYASCFLLGTADSCEGIMKTAGDCAVISKWGGGIGVHINNWRSTGMLIHGTNGASNGIVPFIKIYESTLKAFNQGGRRKGSAALYLSVAHPDIMKFLSLRLPNGNDEMRARGLFYAVWIPDLFMERVKNNKLWSFFDPDQAIDMTDFYNECGPNCPLVSDIRHKCQKQYTEKYLSHEEKKLYTEQKPAREIWDAIYRSNQETGMPYICFSDTANRLSNQKNLGVIKSSNLCAEIYEYSDKNESAVCNLASISLPSCIVEYHTTAYTADTADATKLVRFDFPTLVATVKTIVININNAIDKTFYPTKETEYSNVRNRPMGIGVQGLANVYQMLKLPFESAEALDLNKKIFETIYYIALSQSTRMCREEYLEAIHTCVKNGSVVVKNGFDHVQYDNPDDIPKNMAAYSTMYLGEGSPLANGIFHWELCGLTKADLSGMWDWETLRDHIKEFGVKNSLFVALMPTASTSQLLSNNECFEPYTSNLYKRKTLAGEYIVINKHLITDLYDNKLYDAKLQDYLLKLEGSIQGIENIPDDFKLLYKTAWEIDQAVIIQQAIDRQPFIDQGQSLNLYIENLKPKLFLQLMFKAWSGGLKTGKYYIHTRPSSMPQKFTINPQSTLSDGQQPLPVRLSQPNYTFLNPQVEQCDLCGS